MISFSIIIIIDNRTIRYEILAVTNLLHLLTENINLLCYTMSFLIKRGIPSQNLYVLRNDDDKGEKKEQPTLTKYPYFDVLLMLFHK